jgi:predicted peptidase
MPRSLPLVAGLLLGLPHTAPAETKPDLAALLEKHTFGEGKASLPYRLMKPAGYKTDGTTRYPLVVFLHGSGERGNDNEAQLKHGVASFATDAERKKHPCFLVAPQCPAEGQWANVRYQRRAASYPLADKPSEPGALVLGLIAALEKDYRIDPSRIYLTGLSMGGFGTWDLLSRKPDRFAAALPVCGAGDVKQAKKIAAVPVWVFHGDKDGAVPVECSRVMVEALKEAGGRPVYTEYEGVGHDSWTQTYRNGPVLDWLFAQKKPARSPG